MALDSIKSGENITDQKLDFRKFPTTAYLEQILLYIETSSPLNLSPVTQLIRQEVVTRVSTIESRCSKIWLFSKIVELGIPPSYVIFTLILFSFLTVRHMYKNSISLLCNLLGVIYPTYNSIKAINIQNNDDDDDNNDKNNEDIDLIKSEQKQWLTYWVIYGWLQVADHWSSWLLEFIPGYNFFKLVFLYWAQNDRSRGASLIFERVLKPLLRKPLKKNEKIRQPAQPKQQHQQRRQQQQQRQQHQQQQQQHHHNDNNKIEENITSTVFRHESLEEIWRDPENDNEVKPYRLDNV
ncbi:hypothetical protein Glove_166g247 [Diversispora epigaea]|uniref:Protein YOP1 n=1 Tax=Diversispora epigaea TaxID=1348612 RepID=A0A397ITZ2_9GLOM|nr:hypothetical protein Glove_166g247 [Diversispora epigaea]